MKYKQVNVVVGTNETLSRIVQQLFFDAGYRWGTTGVGYFDLGSWSRNSFRTNDDGTMWTDSGTEGRTSFDAATQMGALVEFLTTNPTIEVKLQNYTAVVTPGEGAQVGCQWASKATIEAVYKAVTAKPKTPELPILLIQVGGNEQLAKIVIELAKAAGYDTDWAEVNLTAQCFRFERGGSGGLTVSREYNSSWEGTRFNAATQMGELVEFLSRPTAPAVTTLEVELKSEGGRVRNAMVEVNQDGVYIHRYMETLSAAEITALYNAVQTK